jgi:hypothetical protein
VQILRTDLATMQAASARADSARARETARLLDALGVVRDSVRALAARDAASPATRARRCARSTSSCCRCRS